MLLTLDIGNTQIMIGVYDKAELMTGYRIATDRRKTSDEYAMILAALFSYDNIKFDEISGIAISCVEMCIRDSITGGLGGFFAFAAGTYLVRVLGIDTIPQDVAASGGTGLQ